MASDKFISYSKFNKKYIDPIINSRNLLNFQEYIYYDLLRENGIDSLRNQYLFPNVNFYRVSQQTYYMEMQTYTPDEKRVFSNEYKSLSIDSFSSTKLLYPYSFDDFVHNFYSDYIPSERDFIIKYLLDFGYVNSFEGYTLFSTSKLPKQYYSIILDNWKKDASLNRIVDLMKEAQDILHNHKRDLSFLLNKVDELSEENKNLKQQNIQLTNNVVRANQITWS